MCSSGHRPIDSDKETDLRHSSKFRKGTAGFFAFVFSAVIVLQVIIAIPSDSKALTDPAEFYSAYVSPASNDHISIEADPPRLSGPGYVNIIIRLTNTNSAAPSNSIGTGVSSIPAVSNDFGILSAGRTDEPDPTPAPTPTPSDPPETTDPTEPPPTEGPTEPPAYDGRYTNVSVENNYNVQFSTSDVEPGKTGVFRGSMMITESLLGQPLSFRLIWYDSAAQELYYRDLSVTVVRSNTTHLSLSRTASVSEAAVGDEVVFTYTLVNTGTVRLTNIRVYDEKLNGSYPINEAFSLGSGEQKEITFTYKMRESSVISSPKAKFTTENGSTEYTTECPKLTIGFLNAQISKVVTAGTPTPEGVNFTVFLTNNGSQSLHDLVVSDELGNRIDSKFTLAIGESKIIDYFVNNPSTIRNVSFTITGTYADGKEFRDNTISYPVYPYLDPNLLGLAFSVDVKRPFDSNNSIAVTINVKNTGKVAYSNVSVTEKELGYSLFDVENLAPGVELDPIDKTITVDAPRELVFYLTATDPSGKTHQEEFHVTAKASNTGTTIPNQKPSSNNGEGVSLKDQAFDKKISDKIEGLANVWRVLEIIFIVALAVVVLIGIIEIILYFVTRSKA